MMLDFKWFIRDLEVKEGEGAKVPAGVHEVVVLYDDEELVIKGELVVEGELIVLKRDVLC